MAETRTVKITVEKVSSVDGRDGPQWELQAKVPWSQYPIKLWMDDVESQDRPRKGDVYCDLTQGKLFEGKTGENDYDYRWHLKQFDVEPGDNPWEEAAPASTQRPRAAPESASRGQSRGNGQRDATGVSIERQVAMKEARPATEWLLQMQPEMVGAAVAVDDGAFVSLYLATLDNIYDHILARIQE